MKEEELIRKGAIYIERIQRGMSEYHSDILHLNEEEAYRTLKAEWKKQGEKNCFVDFYYFFLDETSRKVVRDYLTEEERAYLDVLKTKAGEGEVIFPMDDMLLRMITKLNAGEVLFSTVYFTGEASTWWGNYKEEYIVFRRK